MKDRVPTKPNRYAVYDDNHNFLRYEYHERADEPTQVGDALNKANLLSDATAAKLNGAETPNAAFDLLSRFRVELGNDYIWEKSKYIITLGDQTKGGGTFAKTGTTLYYANDADTILLGGGTTISADVGAATLQSTLRGKYFRGYATYKCWYMGTSAIISFSSPSYISTDVYYYKDAQVETEVSYVNSTDLDAYPPSVSDGYTYTALGKIGEKARIATGSYVGTGTRGSGNSNSLTFDFVPQCVLIQAETSSQFSTAYTLLWCGQSGDATYGLFSLSNKTLYWYGNSAANQKNTSGATYKYVAFG